MKIIIAGAGAVGTHLARMLSNENINVVLDGLTVSACYIISKHSHQFLVGDCMLLIGEIIKIF